MNKLFLVFLLMTIGNLQISAIDEPVSDDKLTPHLHPRPFAVVTSQAEDASSRPSRDDPKISFVLNRIKDDAQRELVWASTLEISKGTSWDKQDLCSIASAIADLKPQQITSVTKCAASLAKENSLTPKDICALVGPLLRLSSQQAEAFVAISQNRVWKVEEFKNVIISLWSLSSQTAPEVGREFALNAQGVWSGSVMSQLIYACNGATPERIGISLKALTQMSNGRDWNSKNLRNVFSSIIRLQCSGDQLDSLLSLGIYASTIRLGGVDEICSLLHHNETNSREELENAREFIKSIPAFNTLEFGCWQIAFNLIMSTSRHYISIDDFDKLSTMVKFLGEDLGWTGNDYLAALQSLTRNSVDYMAKNAPILKEAAAHRNWNADTYGKCILCLQEEFVFLNKNRPALMQALDLIDENKKWIKYVDFLFRSSIGASKEEVLATMKQLEAFAHEYGLDKSSRSELMRNVKPVPFRRIGAILSFIKPIINRTGWHKAYTTLIHSLGHINDEQLRVLTTLVIPTMIEKGLNALESCKYVDALKNMSSREIKSVLDPQLVSGQIEGNSTEDIGFIAYGRSHAPEERVQEVLRKVKEFAGTRGWCAEEQSEFIQHFVNCPWDQIETLLEAAALLSEGKKWCVVTFINLMNALTFQRHDHQVIQNDSRLRIAQVLKAAATGKDWDASKYNAILIAACQTPLGRIEATLTSALTLVEKERLPWESISSLIHLCAMGTTEQVRTVLPQVFSFMLEKGWDSRLQSTCLSCLRGIPFERMVDTLTVLVALAEKQKISLEELSDEEVRTTLSTFSRIDPDRISAVIDAIHVLSKGKSRDISFYAAVAEILGTMDNDEIAAALGRVLAVDVGRELQDYEIVAIMRSVLGIPASRIPELLISAQRIMSTVYHHPDDKMSIYNHFSHLLFTLSHIPINRLDQTLNASIELTLERRLSLYAHTELLRIIRSISLERLAFILKIMPSIKRVGNSNSDMYEGLLNNVTGLVDVKMERIVETLEVFKSLSSEKNWGEDASSRLFLSLCRVPSSCQISAISKKISSAAMGKDWSPEVYDVMVSVLAKVDIDSWDHYLALVEPICEEGSKMNPMHHMFRLPILGQTINLLPESCLAGYLETKVKEYQANPEEFRNRRMRDPSFAEDILTYIVVMSVAGEEYQRPILNYWRDVMALDDKYLVQTVCNFIERHALELGFDEEDQLVQMAMRVLTVFEDGDENGAHTIFEKMKAKRMVPVQWDQLKRIQGSIAGLNVRLDPEKIASFGRCMKIDATSIPMIKSPVWIDMLTRLREVLTEGNGNSDQTLLSKAAKIYRTTMPGYNPENGTFKGQGNINLEQGALELIDEARSPTEHFCRLLDASWKNMEGAKMKCVTNYFLSLPDSEEKWLRICQFLCGVRGCMYGKDTAVQDYYMGLHSEFRLKTLAANKDYDFDLKQLPAITALFNATQSVVSLQFSPESRFMREVCGVAMADAEFEFAAHQIIWVKGLIGDMVGLTEGPRFDIHAGTANRLVLARSLQEVMGIYYDRLELNQIIPLMRTAFDRLLVKDQERLQARLKDNTKDEGDPSIYGAMNHIFEQCKAKTSKEVFVNAQDEGSTPWLEFNFENDDSTDGKLSITDLGIVRLMLAMDVLKENTFDPLGWGK